MKIRVTVRGEGVELRGFIPHDEEALARLCNGVTPAMVLASVVYDDYNPFTNWPDPNE